MQEQFGQEQARVDNSHQRLLCQSPLLLRQLQHSETSWSFSGIASEQPGCAGPGERRPGAMHAVLRGPDVWWRPAMPEQLLDASTLPLLIVRG